MTAKTINIENVTVHLRKSRKARKIIITIKPFEGVIVSVPQRVSYWDGEKVARENIEWIKKHLNKLKDVEKNYPKYDEQSEFGTRMHKLKIARHQRETISVRVVNGIISVKYPSEKDVYSIEIQKAILKGIAAALRKEAKEFLPKRLHELSGKYGLPFNKVYIKNMKSRWGSCSHRNNINLNMQLMQLPDHVIDYVILHELAHTVVRNHSKKYWAFLDKLVGNAKMQDKELRNYSTALFRNKK